jgi:predicted nuclease with TOPRIM domain
VNTVDLSPILIPVIVSLVITAGSAWAVRRWAGPAQAAYESALSGRLAILTDERRELVDKVDDLTSEVEQLRGVIDRLRDKIGDLERQVRELTVENLNLRRRIERDQST